MSLSGNLGFVSLDEVLRLLIRSGQRGRVAVRGEGIEGRVFVTRGGITLATTTTDEGLETLFRKSRLVDSQQVASGDLDTTDQELIDLVREITVESIYRLNLHGDSFDVTEGVEARYGTPKPFELEQLLEESRRRLEDWAEVSQIVSDLDARLAFVRDLGEREEVKIRRDAWKVLSEVGAGASVSQVARELGTTEFWAARVVARLVEDDLLRTGDPAPAKTSEPNAWEPSVEPAQGDALRDTTDSYGSVDPTPRVEEEPLSYFEEPSEPHDETSDLAEEPLWHSEPVAEDTTEETEADVAIDADKSWWQEPSDEQSEAPSGGDVETDEGDVEEDTEAFLEKVFSELDSSDEDEEEGYGLLRRRRLGAMRDIARDT